MQRTQDATAAGRTAEPRIVDDGVRIVYRPEADAPVLAVDHVDLAVADGEFVSIVGPSGCGKTTLLKALIGLLPPAKFAWTGRRCGASRGRPG